SSSEDPMGIIIDEAINPHEILGLSPKASSAKVREAYIGLAKKYHTDTHPGDPVAARRFKRITRAYNQLRSSNQYGGRQKNYRARGFWGSYRQAITIAVILPVLPLLW